MELLLKLSYINDGVVRMLVDTIPECNFNVQDEGQVEIIGWMYQYYNTEPKSAAFGKKVKLQKRRFLQLHSYSHQTGLYGIWLKTVWDVYG